MFLLLGCLSIQAADDLITEQITIKLDEAGTLPAKIGDSRKYKITNLKVIGDINGTDVKWLREMAGSDFQIGVNSLGNLSTLDLQEANIVEGGEKYAYEPLAENDHSTHNDKIGMNMFRNCRKLANLILPSNIKEIGDYAFIWCNALTRLELPESIVSLRRYAFYNCI